LRRHLYGRRRKRRVPPFWEFNLRFKTDSSDKGPEPGHPVLIPASMMGDRAFVIFAAPEEISGFIESKC
jgi:cytochrome c